MAGQNLPGVAVMASYDYEVPWRASLATTGVGTALAAPFGGHAINLAAITAALAAGPDAGPDRSRRWHAADAAGWTYLALAVTAPALVALVTAAPAGIVEAVAGLALLGTLASALRTALGSSRSDRDEPVEPALITVLVAASGTTILGIGAAFWSLVAGLIAHALLVRGGYSGTRR
jgi:benzoate membrane transport protein